MRVILVPVADRPECAIALRAAFETAARLDANVVGCHIRPHREEPAKKNTRRLLVSADGNRWDRDEGRADLRSAAAEKLFRSSAEGAGFELVKKPRLGATGLALWREMVGTPTRIFSVIGPVADVSVVSRPLKRSAGAANAFLLGALMHSGKPVFLLPQKRVRTAGKRMLIAWNGSHEAAASVSAALPLLQRAEQVHIVRCGPQHRPGPKSAHLAQYLTHWNIRAERITTRGGDVANELRAAYRETDSDLLVMGAYSRGRFREIVFGGLTEKVLFDMNLPVLLTHG